MLSVECTPQSLVSTIFSPSPLSAKRCSMSVHRSVQDLKIYRIFSMPMPISYTRGIYWEGCSGLSVERTPPSLEFTTSSPSRLSVKLRSMSVNRSAQDLEIYRIISRPVNIPEAGGILGRAVVGCPSNSHLQVWCLPPPLHHLCLLNFVP